MKGKGEMVNGIKGMIPSEQMAQIEQRHNQQLPSTMTAAEWHDVDVLLAHARALQAERDAWRRGAMLVLDELGVFDIDSAPHIRIRKLRTRLREVEQERDEQRLIYAHMVDSGEVQQLVGNAIEAFRQRAVEAVRAKRAEWWAKVDSDGESNRAAWMHHSDAAGKLINLIESLPATTNEEVGQ